MVHNALLKEAIIFANVHRVSQVKGAKVKILACQIHVTTAVNAFHNLMALSVNALKDFQVNAAKTKCQQTHVNQTHVKTEACA